jgi:hypothetical protein
MTDRTVDQAPRLAAAAAAEAIYQAAVKRQGAPDPRRDSLAPAPPASLGEWIDRQITGGPHAPHDPAIQAAWTILEAARKGPAEAAAAVHEAAALTGAHQWAVFRSLTALAEAGYKPGAAAMRAALAEWQACGLADHSLAKPAEPGE